MLNVRDIVGVRETPDSTAWAGERKVSTKRAIPARAIAMPLDLVRQAARSANENWLEWLSQQLIAGLWDERYRLPVLAFFARTSPIRVYLCSRSESAHYAKVYSRLRAAVPEIETGRDVLRSNVLPLVLWQPPSTMVRLWPLPDREVSSITRLVVDVELATYASSPIDPANLRILEHDVDQRMDYAIVPQHEHGTFAGGNKHFQYVNRFCRWGQPTGRTRRIADAGETGDSELDEMLEEVRDWFLRGYGE